MQIAVIGWGSLIWCPGCLRIKSRWHSDGPALPVEFARISGDGRLTLVIHPGSPEQPTYWALSQFEAVQQARENLGAREGTKNLKNIHLLTAEGEKEGKIDPRVASKVEQWLKDRLDVQAAIWTGLTSNWPHRRDRQFTREDAVQYVGELERSRDEAKAAYDRAHEYISNAPSQIQTPVRKMIRESRGWKDETLSEILFETRSGNQNR